MSVASPLTPKQQAIWGLLRLGLSRAEVAEKLRSSRQYVHQVAQVAEAKIAKAMLDVAQTAQLQVKRIDAPNGILLAHDPVLRSNVVITYTNKNGMRLWHWHTRLDHLQDPEAMEEVRAYLLNEAQERGLTLTPEEQRLHPAKLAHLLFSRLIPGLTP